MKVFKFGGASVNSVERIQKVAAILKSFSGEKLVVVISAMGKTTNALEKVAEAFFHERKDEALQLFQAIRDHHIQTAKYLLVTTFNETENQLNDFFTEAEWLLHDKPVKSFDYYYDQLVCTGELMSSSIVCSFLKESGIAASWIDVRDIFRTDDNFRDATIEWDFTLQKVTTHILPLLHSNKVVITQGFIGSTDENESTTLGREGSDYTAAVFANMLNAESLTIWKDVQGVMNADPKDFPEAQYLPALSYEEVIEMAYYGAQVIHPKTIKPLHNKNIALHVKCFLDKELPGTIIQGNPVRNLPPIIVLKKSQVLLHLRSTDFSFVGEKPVAELYHLFEELKIKPNLIQTGAVSIQLCLDDHTDKIEKLAIAAAVTFDVELEKGLTLITIRHDDGTVLSKVMGTKKPEMMQQVAQTVQVLVR
ncbi:MAG TPA: aspartate kinase [Flavitalea sp.]|nr:aspartate kinase [Flavitalea sp.]